VKIIITGACGHIGSYLVSNIHRIKRVKEIFLIDNFHSKKYWPIFNLKNKPKFTFHQLDISENNSLNIFKKIDLVIHCASYTNAENSFSIKKEMYRNNINCMKNVINFCIKKKAKLFHLSSTSVYGKQVKIVHEDDEKFLNPQSPYAEIKLTEEKILKKNKQRLKYMTFRLGTITGISKGMRFHTAINKFCLNAGLNKEIEVYKTAYNQYRPYLSLKDLFLTFKYCIEKEIYNNDIYNVLSGNYSVKQIINKIKKYKKKVGIKFVNSSIMNQLSYLVDDTKIKKIGIKLKSKIDVDIKQTLSLLSENKNDL
jgi:UDP-glucose 4-epimerase